MKREAFWALYENSTKMASRQTTNKVDVNNKEENSLFTE